MSAPGGPEGPGPDLARRLWFRPDGPAPGGGGCHCCCLSADGSMVVRADGSRLYAVDEQGHTVWTAAKPPSGVARLVWSPGGEVVVLTAGGAVAVHDGDTGVLRAADEEQTAAAASFGPGSAGPVVTGDGLRIAYPVGDGVAVRHRSGAVPGQRLPVREQITGLAWDAAGRLLCVATPQALRWWNPALRQPNRPALAGRSGLSAVACSPVDATVAFADAAGVHLLYAGTDGPHASAEPGAPVVALAFSPSGRSLVAATTERVLVFPLDHGLDRSVSLPAAPRTAGDFDMSACGRFLVRCAERGESGTALWELSDAQAQPSAHRPAARLRRWAAAMCASVGRALPLPGDTAPSAGPPVVLAPSGGGSAAPGFAWGEDGRYVYEPRPGTLAARHPDLREELWTADVPTGEHGAYDLEISPAPGGSLAVATRSGAVPLTVVSVRRGAVRTTVPGGQAPAWSPVDADRLAVPEPGPAPTHLFVYDVSQGTRLSSHVRTHVGRPAWSPDGRLLTAGTRGGVLMWRMPEFSRTRPVLPLPAAAFATRVAWSPDGTRLAVTPSAGQGPLTVWDCGTWQIQRELGAPGGIAWAPALAWSPDGTLLAAPGPGEGTALVQVWDVSAAAVVLTLEPPSPVSGHLWSVRWSPDGRRLATTYRGGTTLLWEIRPRRGGASPAAAGLGASGAPAPEARDPRRNALATAPHRALPLQPAALAGLGAAAAAAGAAVPLSALAELAGVLTPLEPDAADATRPHDSRAAAALRSLQWPPAARAALTAVVAAQLPPDSRFAPPEHVRPAELRDALEWGLRGAPVPPLVARVPTSDVAAALERTRGDLLPTLRLLGPDALARDPGLALSLTRGLVRDMDAAVRRRRSTGTDRSVPAGDETDGPAAQGVPAGLVRSGSPDRLVPSHQALPDDVLDALDAQDALLYRTRRGTAPEAASGGAALVLDTGPGAHGQVGTCLRVCAHILADTLLRAGRGVELLHLGTAECGRRLLRPTDLRLLWLPTPATAPGPPSAAHTGHRVRATLARLSDSAAASPRAVMLTHPYEPRLDVPGTLTLRVHYPGRPVRTAEPDCWTLSPTPRPERLRAVLDTMLAAL